jgi:predicted NAD-dependent protein-ADP-ribosyltransferase YbiA (DUF1768 family)
MELFSAEAENIKKKVEEWITHPEYELEATFGATGEVDSTTFLSVAQRLRAKGYASLPQEDRMTVITPEHVRYTLSSLGVIQAYCKDDVMGGKPYTVMIKDRATADSQIDLEDYDTRIKVRRERDMAQDDASVKKMLAAWPQQRKAFRIIRRWAFHSEGIRIDMSIVRSTQKLRNGDYKWQRSFRDQDVMMQPASYEIEVELQHLPDDTPESAMKRLIRGIGEVLRGIQKNTVLIRKETRKKVLAAYKELTNTDMFRGPALRTLRKENFVKERTPKTPNIRDGYNVTDKADGLRCMAFVDSKGDLYLIDMGMNVYRTGLRNPALRLSLIDGEWVTQTKDEPPKPLQQFLAFDIFYATDKRDVSQFPFEAGATLPAVEGAPPPVAPPPENSRYYQLNAWVATWNKDAGPKVMTTGLSPATKLLISSKEFLFGKAGNDSIFRLAARALSASRPYYTDGLIFTPNALPLPEKAAATFWEQLKWKPVEDNTIDFLVVTEKLTGSKNQDKIVTGIKAGPSGETVNYKTLRLYVGSNKENARDIILNRRDLPRRDRTPYGSRKKEYKPVIFTPKEFPDPMAAICRLPIQTDPDTGEEYVMTADTEEPIQDKTIVEMAYDSSQPPGWRWKPLRVRMDKTERLQRGTLSRTLNSEAVAEDAWNSIHDPVTTSMIKTGVEEPTAEEMTAIMRDASAPARKYFDREEPIINEAIVEGMKKFHGRYIRGEILYKMGLSGGKYLMDTACGVAGDMHNWMRAGVEFVMGFDYAAKNIMDSNDSAYTRYMNLAVERGGLDSVPPMVFAIADATKPLVDGAAGNNDQEKDILRSVFGKVKPLGSVPAYVEEYGASKLKMGADCISCMFAIHYFFETPGKLNGFLENLSQTLKVGGYFIGCCFDGQKVFDLLEGVPKGKSKVGTDKGTTLWEITKQYDAEELPEGDGGFGMGIDASFISIGMPHREYLVPFKLLEEKMRLIGCELLAADELKELGMVNSTATFDVSWEMAKKKGTTYNMITPVKEFSFLNRWFVFKRKRQETLATAEAVSNATAVPVSTQIPKTVAPVMGRSAAMRAKVNAVAEAANAIQASGQEAAATAKEAAASTNESSAAQQADQGVSRTVPVEPGPAAVAKKSYALGEVVQFYADAATSKDVLGIEDKGAVRWLAPSAPFPIKDGEVQYPTIEHYIAGMRAKLATDKPELANTIFSREGTIHQRFLNDRLGMTNGGTKQLTEEEDHELLKTELAAVKAAMSAVAMKKHRAVVDEAKWATIKDKILQEALKQRWTLDKRFRKTVEAARNQGKYLLYYTPGASTNLGGKRDRATGHIDGENRIGKIIMKLAGYPE